MDFQRGDISFASEDGQHQESAEPSIEREHMFDKVVTPSDVGKLNRLVIPKQHAEKYFPLDSAANEKGLLLSFEDRAGKPWRFRYSYWNSSQSYVMTKGWSRFVKDKRLDAGDTVSFGRGLNDTDRLFIDWKRRAAAPPLPPPPAPVIPAFAFRSPVTLWSPLYDRHRQLVYFQSSVAPRVLESVPVVRSSTKRVRLFGVNLECPETDDHAPLQLRLGGIVGEASSSEELQLDLDM